MKFLWLLIPLAILVQPARATVTCVGSYTMDPTTGLPSTGGCEQGDKFFSQFSSYVNNGSPPSPGSIDLDFTGTNPAGPITDTFTSSGWVNTTATGSIFLYNYTQVDQVAQPGYVLTGFDLNPGSFSFVNSCGASCNTIQIITDFCTNVDTNACSDGDANFGQVIYGATATFGVTDQQYCYGSGSAPNACTNGSYSGATAVTFDPSLDITSVFVTNWIIINNYDGNAVTLNGFSNDYYEAPDTAAPEPGTLVLLGIGLGGAWCYRRVKITGN